MLDAYKPEPVHAIYEIQALAASQTTGNYDLIKDFLTRIPEDSSILSL
jgi:hypothetical protein